eukprot:gene22296-29373_t
MLALNLRGKLWSPVQDKSEGQTDCSDSLSERKAYQGLDKAYTEEDLDTCVILVATQPRSGSCAAERPGWFHDDVHELQLPARRPCSLDAARGFNYWEYKSHEEFFIPDKPLDPGHGCLPAQGG